MKRLFSLLLLVLIGLFISREAVAKLDPESHAILSDPGYAKHIEVQCYLVTREQLAELFSKESSVIVQKTNKELYSQDLFFLVRCRNKGKYVAGGILNCCPPSFGSPIPVKVVRMPSMRPKYHDSVIYIGDAIAFPNNELPKITYEWDYLYTM